MFRAGRPLLRLSASSSTQLSRTRAVLHSELRSSSRLPSRPALLRAALPQHVAAYATRNDPPNQELDRKHEREVAQQKLETKPPEEVTVDSTTVAAFAGPQPRKPAKEVSEDVKSELHAIKDAFALDTVPAEVRALGLAGTLPYLATSLSTMFLSWNVGQTWSPDSAWVNSILVNHETAEQYLAMLEPVQIGYGAVILSFLGAIHWGMEWNERTPSQQRARARYAIGVMAPALAWPTILMPAPAALTTQFFAFTALYFVDGNMAQRGWTPRWYAPYRFMLTFVVGVALFISLVGRAKIGERQSGSTRQALDQRFHQKSMAAAAADGTDWEADEKKVKEQRKREREEKDEGAEEKDEGAEEKDGGAEEKDEGAEKDEGGEEKKSQPNQDGKQKAGDGQGEPEKKGGGKQNQGEHDQDGDKQKESKDGKGGAGKSGKGGGAKDKDAKSEPKDEDGADGAEHDKRNAATKGEGDRKGGDKKGGDKKGADKKGADKKEQAGPTGDQEGDEGEGENLDKSEKKSGKKSGKK